MCIIAALSFEDWSPSIKHHLCYVIAAWFCLLVYSLCTLSRHTLALVELPPHHLNLELQSNL